MLFLSDSETGRDMGREREEKRKGNEARKKREKAWRWGEGEKRNGRDIGRGREEKR